MVTCGIEIAYLACTSAPQVIELEPKNERNFYKRFRVFLSKRRYAEAISDLSRALELKPKYKQVIRSCDALRKVFILHYTNICNN